MNVLEQQIAVMLELQNGINSRVNSAWRQQGYEWYRAIWVECAELLDHYGWKWWKKQSPDLDQVHLELIDIWHFGLSLLLQQNTPVDQLAVEVAAAMESSAKAGDFREDLETFAASTLVSKSFSVSEFSRLMDGVQLDSNALYRGYVGKNVLNFFRQDHGYKEGTYVKVWGGKEDNEHLVEALSELDASSPTFSDDLYAALVGRYPV